MYTDSQVNQSQVFTNPTHTIGSGAQTLAWGKKVFNLEGNAIMHQENNESSPPPSTLTRHVRSSVSSNNSFFPFSASAMPIGDKWGAQLIPTFSSKEPIKTYTQLSNVIVNDKVREKDRLEIINKGNIQSIRSHTEPSIEHNTLSVMLHQPKTITRANTMTSTSSTSQSMITGSDKNNKPQTLSTQELYKIGQMCTGKHIDTKELLESIFKNQKFREEYFDILHKYKEINIINYILQPDRPVFNDKEKSEMKKFFSDVKKRIQIRISRQQGIEIGNKIEEIFILKNTSKGIKVNIQDINEEKIRGKLCIKQRRYNNNVKNSTSSLESELTDNELTCVKQQTYSLSFQTEVNLIFENLKSISEKKTEYTNLLKKYDLNILASLIACNYVKQHIDETLHPSDISIFDDLRAELKQSCRNKANQLKYKLYKDLLKRTVETKKASRVTLVKSNNYPTQNEFGLIQPIHSVVNNESFYSKCKIDAKRSSEFNTAKESTDMIYNGIKVNEAISQNNNCATIACESINKKLINYDHSEYLEGTKSNTQNSTATLDSTLSVKRLSDIHELLSDSYTPIEHKRKRLVSEFDYSSFCESKKLRTDEEF